MRRLRQHEWLRLLVQEHELRPHHLIMPLFVHDHPSTPIESLPTQHRLSLDDLLHKAEECLQHGITAIALFPVIDDTLKDDNGSHALQEDNLLCRAIAHVKKHHPQLGVIADVALDPFTSHGHDGIVRDGTILNDETVAVLCRQAVLQAHAGADIIAPSDMMDGRIAAIRQSLDESQHTQCLILSYGAKYASAFYGPFRDAVGSRSLLGTSDKKTYQMDCHNRREALREIAFDIDEGADMVMVKPALPYLDVIHHAAQSFAVPLFAYQVSGEYAMLRHASAHLSYDDCLLESLVAIRRAGAQAIVSYGALDAARLLTS